MVDERPRLAASEIEEGCSPSRKLPTLHDTQSVTICPYSGPRVGHGNWENRTGSRT